MVIHDFRRGTRAYFANSKTEIESKGVNVNAVPIHGTKFRALVTLDNRTKRLVVEDILRTMGYSSADIELAIAQLPDSGIRRRRTLENYA